MSIKAKDQYLEHAFCNQQLVVSVLIVSLLPLGEGPGEEGGSANCL